MRKKYISFCPACGGDMYISRINCSECDTEINSVLPTPPFAGMPEDIVEFALTFLRCRGNIKEVEKELGISYPTVCKRLDIVNEFINKKRGSTNQNKVLDLLEQGDISPKHAARLLNRRK